MSLSIIHIIDIVIYNYIDIVKCPRVLQSNYSLYTSNNSYIAKYNIQNRLINNTLINITVYPTAFIQNDFLVLQSTGRSIQSNTSLNVTLFNRFNGCTATSPSCNPNRPCLLYTKSCPVRLCSNVGYILLRVHMFYSYQSALHLLSAVVY